MRTQEARQAVLEEVTAEMARTEENAQTAPSFEDYIADIARRFGTLLDKDAVDY